MDLEATKQFISDQGWTPQEKARRKSGNLYLYAARWLKGQTEWRYIAPLSKLAAMSEQEILAKLNRQ